MALRSFDCDSVYLKPWIGELALLCIAVILSIVLCFLGTRSDKTIGKRQWFSFIIPLNLMGMRGHKAMILATFTLATVKILNSAVWHNGFKINTNIVMINVCITILGIVLMSMAFLPLLACITTHTLASNVCGLIYVTLYVSLAIVYITPACPLSEMGVFQIAVMVKFNIFVFVSGVFLIIKFILRLLGRAEKTSEILLNIKIDQINYVKRLLNSRKLIHSKEKNQTTSKLKLCCQNKVYKQIPEFRYSLLILISIYVGMLSVIGILVVYTATFCDEYFKLQDQIDDWNFNNSHLIPPILKAISSYVLKKEANDENIIKFLDRQGTSIFGAAILSLFLGFFSAIFHSLAFAKSYRNLKLHVKRRQELEKLLEFDKLPNAYIVVRAMQFAGFQIAYLIWGYHVQSGFVFFVSLIVIETIILPADSLLAFIIRILQSLTPVGIFIIFTAIVQHLLVRKFFLSDRGEVLALKNRKGFLNFLYIMLFYNVFNGIYACWNRFFKWLFTGVWFYVRLDRTTLARGLEKCDVGLVCFVSLLKIEDSENNPIMHSFLEILSRNSVIKKNVFSTKKGLASKRWFLAWTLIHNINLRNERKSNLAIKEKQENYTRL